MTDQLTLIYIILCLQLVSIILTISIVVFFWFKYGKGGFRALNSVNNLLDWANSILPEGDFLPGEITVKTREQLQLAVEQKSERIIVQGGISYLVDKALKTFSDSMLIRLHSTLNHNSGTLETVVSDLNPDPIEMNSLAEELGPELIAKMALHYLPLSCPQNPHETVLTIRKET